MIRAIRVKGFRSLNPLYLELKKGLNVFVGSNGSGKTNLMCFLNFLHDLSGNSVHQAVQRAGGISRVFSKENTQGNTFELEYQIFGNFSDDPHLSVWGPSSSKITVGTRSYEYQCKIVFDMQSGVLFIQRESIDLELSDGSQVKAVRKSEPWKNKGKHELRVSPHENPLVQTLSKRYENPTDYEESLSAQISEDSSILNDFAYRDSFVWPVRMELASLSMVNIDPNEVRNTDSLTDYPFVEPNGSGTIPTLFSLSNKMGRRRVYYYDDGSSILKSITSWSKEVMQDLKAITVGLDAPNLRYSASVTLDGGEEFHDQEFPFASLSDGTLKWIALVTTLFCSGGKFTIEEPENFLHPRMQRTLVKLLNSVLDESNFGQCFVTTHSETFLDACSVDDLFIVEFDAGHTVISRPSNAIEIKQRLEEGQFGLGHYYKTGAIYGS